jgi:hypothetical protein
MPSKQILSLQDSVINYVESNIADKGTFYRSSDGGPGTLYGTVYAHLIKVYLTGKKPTISGSLQEILHLQDSQQGYFIGPEVRDWEPDKSVKHSREHVLLHLACTVLPLLDIYNLAPLFPLRFAHKFNGCEDLESWLENRDWSDAWLEGNNLLFVGQLLVFLRDKEGVPGAQQALDLYFDWLDKNLDPETGLWGTNGYCSPFIAMCGGYHQLLVYYYENRDILYPEKLIDTVLSLQHIDGGFSPKGGGGACEDVDAVDILVNLYKMVDYKRPEIRSALRRCLRHILSLQNPDGGFPYNRTDSFSHLNIPATFCQAGKSNMFSTWFRVHTLALIAEVLTDEPILAGVDFHFNSTLSMGWHRKWPKVDHRLFFVHRLEEFPANISHILTSFRWHINNGSKVLRKLVRKIKKRF